MKYLNLLKGLASPLSAIPLTWWLIIILSVLLGLSRYQVQGIKLDAANDLAAKNKAIAEEQAARTQISKEVSRAYQKDIADIYTRYAAINDRRMRKQRADGGISNPAAGSDGAANGDGLPELLREAEINTLRLIRLQEWVAKQEAH